MSNELKRGPSRNPEGSGGKKDKKWNHTLRHLGPMFSLPYEKIPGPSRFKYNRKRLDLSVQAEEVAVFYAKYLMRTNRNKRQEKILNVNFFKDWREKYMTNDERETITDLSKCDVNGIIKYLQEKAKENMDKPSEERRKEREARQAKIQPYKTVIVDGREEELSNCMVEPPGLFFGRGDNNRIGKVKPRILPKHVVINCDEHSIPEPPPGLGNWKQIVNENWSMWLAKWDDPITGRPKYIQLDPGSKFKSDNDKLKYDKAEELKQQITDIREKYTAHLKSEDLQERQHATALYIIDNFAIRAGNEKNEGEVDTVGCCSLRKEHIQLGSGNMVELNFNGKDSIPYNNKVKVIREVHRNLDEFRNEVTGGQMIFFEISTESLNRYLNKLMPNLTAKVFRTFKATECFQGNIERFMEKLGLDPEDDSEEMSKDDIKELKIVFDRANLEVAKLLNHRTLVKNSGRKKAIDKLDKKVRKMQDNLKRFRGDVDRKAELQKKLRICKAELDLKRSMDNFSLSTSKVNYIDPRVVLNWCEKYGVAKEKIYTKGQLKKFKWAVPPGEGHEEDDDMEDLAQDEDEEVQDEGIDEDEEVQLEREEDEDMEPEFM